MKPMHCLVNEYVFLFLLLVRCQYTLSCSTLENNTNSKWLKTLNGTSIFSHFTSFEQLILACNQTYDTSDALQFVPRKRLLIDKTFQLDRLIDASLLPSMEYVAFVNAKGLDLNFRTDVKLRMFFLTFSVFDIYLDGKLTRDCDSKTYALDRNTIISIVNAIIFNQNIYPTQGVCPLLFVKAKIKYLSFNDIANTLLVKNRLKFIKLNETTTLG